MMIYGYTRVCSESDINGKESTTLLFTSQKERNDIMYEDYSDTFDTMESEGEFETADVNGNEKQTKDEFMKEIEESKNKECDVFGLIQAHDYHVQFEPFCRAV